MDPFDKKFRKSNRIGKMKNLNYLFLKNDGNKFGYL